MAVSTESKTARKVSLPGLVALVLSAIALIAPFAYIGYAKVAGKATLSTEDQINTLLKGGIIIAIVAVVFGLIALIFTGRSVVNGMSSSRLISAIVSLLLTVLAVYFLVGIMIPRASAVNNIKQNIAPFATAIQDNCGTPLTKTTNDITQARNDAQANATNDTGFAQAMLADAGVLTSDAHSLTDAAAKLDSVKAPEAKYQGLLDDCKASLRGEADFLTNPSGANAIPLPAPYNALVAKVSGTQLLQDAALVASGAAPIQVPPGTMQPLVIQALNQVLATKNPKLTNEGNQLSDDITSTLKNNLSPFTVTMPLG